MNNLKEILLIFACAGTITVFVISTVAAYRAATQVNSEGEFVTSMEFNEEDYVMTFSKESSFYTRFQVHARKVDSLLWTIVGALSILVSITLVSLTNLSLRKARTSRKDQL